MRVSGLLHDVLDFCLPAACANCSAAANGDGFLCHTCETALSQLTDAPSCEWCAMPIAEENAPCPYCLGKGAPHYERIVALGKFVEPIKSLVHHLKYHRRWAVGEKLARRLAHQDRVRRLLEGADCLVPVPLHRLRQISRGYNQAEIIARALCLTRKISICRPVKRSRNTETQTHLHSQARRFENLADAFRLVRPQCVEGKAVLVIDDVMTSGATLQMIARTLKPAAPRKLSAIVIGIADPRGRHFEGI